MTPGGQQWSLPARVYDLFVKKYGATLEGFASPFNSQMIHFMPGASADPASLGLSSAKNIGFCSLFPDLDAAFGSLGNFFNVDLAERVSVINPPYVTDMIDAIVRKCSETCKNAANAPGTTRMFIVVPNWTDADFYNKLSTSPYLEKMLVHQKGTHFHEDPNNSENRIVATFARTIFILSSGAGAGAKSGMIIKILSMLLVLMPRPESRDQE